MRFNKDAIGESQDYEYDYNNFMTQSFERNSSHHLTDPSPTAI
jgi:hypothetical protein